VVSTETLDADGQRLAVSLTTLEFEPTGKGSNLRVTVQMVSFVGPGMIAGYEAGNKSALENLSRHLDDDLGSAISPMPDQRGSVDDLDRLVEKWRSRILEEAEFLLSALKLTLMGL
jgi:hypothetical protein